MKGATLRVEHLVKVYPEGTTALRDVTFTVRPGEFLVIIGLSRPPVTSTSTMWTSPPSAPVRCATSGGTSA